jgi:D-psicose/D-tagatose/L-ribulose 3-epimerase
MRPIRPEEPMRLTLCNEVVRELSFAQQCALAAGLGYVGLEIAPFTLDPEAPHLLPAGRRAELRRIAAEEGVAITSLHWLLVAPSGLSVTSADPERRARTLEVMERLIWLAAELGAGVLVHGSPGQRRVEAPDDAARAEAALARAGDWAAAAGVTYCLEPLAARETNWATTVAEAAAIVERIGNPALRTMLDVSAAGNGEEEPAAALLNRWLPGGLLAHVHLNDRNRRAPGQGEDRFAPVLAALRRHGYAGLCGVEPFEYLPDGPTCAAFAAGHLQGVWATLEDAE